jgi:hypothetical protein
LMRVPMAGLTDENKKKSKNQKWRPRYRRRPNSTGLSTLSIFYNTKTKLGIKTFFFVCFGNTVISSCWIRNYHWGHQ